MINKRSPCCLVSVILPHLYTLPGRHKTVVLVSKNQFSQKRIWWPIYFFISL